MFGRETVPADDDQHVEGNLDFHAHASMAHQHHNQYLKKKGLLMGGSDVFPSQSNRSLANPKHNPMSNRDHKRGGIMNVDSNQ